MLYNTFRCVAYIRGGAHHTIYIVYCTLTSWPAVSKTTEGKQYTITVNALLS